MLPRLTCLLLIICVFFSCKDTDSIPVVDTGITQLDMVDKLIEQAKDKNKLNEERIKLLEKAYNDGFTSKVDDKIRRLQEISYVYFILKDLESYKSMNEEILNIANAIDDSINIAKSYFNLGIYYRNSQLDIAYKYFYDAQKLYAKLEKTQNITFEYGKTLIDLARIKQRTKEYIESESITIKAIEQFKLSGNNSYLPLCYTNLGINAKYLERYEESIEYHKKAIKYARGANKDTLYFILGHNNIGTTYKSQKKYLKAQETYREALKYKDFLKKDRRRYALLIDNLAYVKFLSNDLENIPELFYQALKIRDSIQDKTGLSTNNLHLAEYYQSTGNFKRAKSFALTTKKLAKQLGNNDELLKSYQILSKVSNPKEGLQYAEAYIKLNDSLVKEERLFRDKIARIQFETEEKEQQIVEKEAQIVQKEAQIATVENRNTIYLLGILLLLMGIGFAIYFFKQRTKYLAQQNQMVQFQASYETETRISKRLHDDLGNDIFQVMLQYQNDPHDSQILEKLNTTYARARDISRENNEFDIDESFPEELSDMLKNYTKNGIQLLVRGLDKINWQGFEAPVKITVYRVLQELMTNMQKHSQASMVVLVFNQDNNTLHIKYTDNGVGIDKKQLQSKNGLHNTEKRIHAIDGTLIFESEKEKGFKADIKIPA